MKTTKIAILLAAVISLTTITANAEESSLIQAFENIKPVTIPVQPPIIEKPEAINNPITFKGGIIIGAAEEKPKENTPITTTQPGPAPQPEGSEPTSLPTTGATETPNIILHGRVAIILPEKHEPGILFIRFSQSPENNTIIKISIGTLTREIQIDGQPIEIQIPTYHNHIILTTNNNKTVHIENIEFNRNSIFSDPPTYHGIQISAPEGQPHPSIPIQMKGFSLSFK